MAVAAGSAGVSSVAAHERPTPTHAPEVVASGLNAPRQLAFSPGGALYVAEAGTTGTSGCQPSPLDPAVQACVGLTGSVARIGHAGRVTRVVTGLPSAGTPSEPLGPADLVFTGTHRFALTIGLGGDPAYRTGFGPQGSRLGTLVQVDLRSGHHRAPRVTKLADLTGYEARVNPDGTDVDSNPVGLARSRGGFVYADAGANAVNSTRHGGSTVAVLAPVPTTQPSPVGPPGFPADAVPTDVVKGPDGAWYVSQLVGFPFEKGASTIWRVVPGHAPTAYATGLTNVTSLAFDHHGRLYAVEIAADGLLSGPIGALVRVRPGSTAPEVVAGGLFAPYGLALRGHHAYVTTHSTEPGAGQVVKIDL
ncbi:ScyD/ScyE family protein [Terrabacter sp. NPDC000476]|uniref:ScyD/ScyE family protein n=1 Tax=Terrabacter sp. NPDC000476 TaxID=3154258 RepID=UPI0033222436